MCCNRTWLKLTLVLNETVAMQKKVISYKKDVEKKHSEKIRYKEIK